MLRLLTLSDSLRGAQAAQRTVAEQRDRAREEELQKLRDELQRTQAELDRIKRRLGPPKP
jgi:molecular chaperone GrpE (heat shock protein)